MEKQDLQHIVPYAAWSRHSNDTQDKILKYLDHKLFFIKFPRAIEGQHLA